MSRKGMELCGDRGLLAIIQDVHMVNSGASEVPKEIYEEDRKILQGVLENWEDLSISPIYDWLVKALLVEALSEQLWYQKLGK